MSKEWNTLSVGRYAISHPIRFIRGVRPDELSSASQDSQKRRQAKNERIVAERARNNAIGEYDSVRRGLVKGLAISGGLIAAGGAGYVGKVIYDGILADLPTQDIYTGEIDETTSILSKWNEEVKDNPQKLEKYMPHIASLATSYFARQMSEKFPEFAFRYDKDTLRSKVEIVDEKTFIQEGASCAGPMSPRTPAFSDELKDRIYANAARLASIKTNHLAKDAFFMFTHELLHLSPKLVRHEPGVQLYGIKEPVVHQKGLKAVHINQTLSRKRNETCYDTSWYQLEETVAEDATVALIEQVGIDIPNGGGYLPWVNIYRKQILPLVNGNRWELLSYQQRSDITGFLQALGRQRGAKTPDEQIDSGARLAAIIQ